MKKLFLSISILIISLASFSQLPNSIWNHQRYALGNLRGTRWGADITSTSTRYVLFDDIEGQFLNDSVFIHRNTLNHFRDSIFGVLNASIALKINISDSGNMLLPYVRKGDTANMLSPYARSANYYTKAQADAKYDLIITAPFTVNKYFTGYKTFGTLNSDSVIEAGNQYFTQARVRLTPITGFTSGAGTLAGTDNILQAIQKLDGNITNNTTAISGKEPTITAPFTIKKYWNGYKQFVSLNSDSLAEGSSNPFFTNARVQSFGDTRYELIITPPYTTLKYWNGYKQFVPLNTDSIPEGTNKFFTNARAQSAITVTTTGSSGAATYISGTLNIPNYSAGGGMTNPMTTLGDIIYENSTPAATRLAGNITTTKKFLSQTGDGVNSAAPGWNTIAVGDVPTLNQNTTGSAGSISASHIVTNANMVQMAANSFKANNTGSIADQTDITAAQAKTLLAISEGDVANLSTDLNAKITNPLTTLGDILYENATPAPTRLAGNITTTNKFLTQVGNGSNSAAPGWNAIQTTDVPTLNQNTTGSAGSISGTNVITNTNLAQMPASTIKINNTGGSATPIDGTVAQTKTLLNYVEGDIPSLTTDLGNKQPITTVSTGLTSAGSTQGTALVLTGNNSLQEITTAAAGTGVQVPVATTSSLEVIINRGANAIVIYPATGGKINNQTANAGYTLGVNNSVTLFGKSSTDWYTDDNFQGGDVASSDNSSSLLIGANKVTNSQLAQMATNTMKGNNTGGTGNAADLTVAQVQTLLSLVTTARLLSIGGKQFDLTADRSWSIGVSLPGTINVMTAASSAINTTETALMTSASIAANQLTAGSEYEVELTGTCTSSAANVSHIRVRIGTLGTTGDAIVCDLAPTAATSGTTITFFAKLKFSIRTTGVSGTAAGGGFLMNTGTTGISSVADLPAPVLTPTVNTTAANIITVWYVSAATTTTSTFQMGDIKVPKI